MAALIGLALFVVVGVSLTVVATRSAQGTKRARPPGPSGPSLARSSAGDVVDAGAYDFPSVLEALSVPPGEEVSDRTGEDIFGSQLGLRTIIVTGGAYQPNVMFGSRQGRCVEIRIGHDEKLASLSLGPRHIREITMVGAHSPEFALRGANEKLTAEGQAPAAVLDMLGSMNHAEVWNGVRIVAGEEGLVANRPYSGQAYGWAYDLWLLERLADHLDAKPRAAAKRWPRAKVPYGMGTWTG